MCPRSGVLALAPPKYHPADDGVATYDVAVAEVITCDTAALLVRDIAPVNLTGEFLEVRGDLTSNEPADRALIVIDASTVNATGLLRVFSPASLTLASPLLVA